MDMAHVNTVIRSVNLPGDAICVDVFRRPDGSFGFDEFRRDAEDGRGWFAVGRHGAMRFDTADAALDAARQTVPWLADVLNCAG